MTPKQRLGFLRDFEAHIQREVDQGQAYRLDSGMVLTFIMADLLRELLEEIRETRDARSRLTGGNDTDGQGANGN